jgi:hypothetical protein
MMKKGLRWLGKGILAVILLIVCLILIERIRGSLAFNTRYKELKAKGERLTVGELEPRPVALESNAALLFVALSNQVNQLNTNLGELPPNGRFSAPGRMVTPWQHESWKDVEGMTNTWSHLSESLESGEDFFAALHAAVQRPEWDAGINYHNCFFDLVLPALPQIKKTSQILNGAAACELKKGRNDKALERLQDTIRIVALQKDERLIIAQLVRILCANMSWNTTWKMLQTNVWSEPELARIQGGWQQMDFSVDMERAMEMERALTLDHFDMIQRSSTNLNRYVEMVGKAEAMLGNEFSFLPTHGFVLHRVHLPIWRFAWLKQDDLHALNCWQDIIETERLARIQSIAAAAQSIARLNSNAETSVFFQTQDKQPKQSAYNRWRFLISSDTGVNGNIIRKTVQAETARRMLITALALKRYSLQHGRAPKSLESLVPGFLPAVPIDGMDGKPMRYRLIEDGTFLLYSVGEDGVDDGGDCSLVKGKERATQIWDGKDAVWPSPARPEEVPTAIWSR